MKDHPLFPPGDDDESPPDIGKITVCRKEGARNVTIPRQFEPEELVSLEQIHESFGGGTYELFGRTLNGKRIAAKRVYELPGPSRPLTGEPTATQSTPTVHASGGGDTASLLLTLMTAQQHATAAQSASMLAFLGTIMQSQNQMVMAMMSKDSEAARNHIAQMQSLFQGFAGNQAELFKTMAEAKGAGAPDAFKAFEKGLEFATEMSARDDDKDDGDSTMSEIQQGLSMVQQLDSLTKGGGGSAPQAANAAE